MTALNAKLFAHQLTAEPPALLLNPSALLCAKKPNVTGNAKNPTCALVLNANWCAINQLAKLRNPPSLRRDVVAIAMLLTLLLPLKRPTLN